MRAADRIGSVIASKYRLDRLLGEGGMGAVFCATHLTVGKRFAIKLLHADISKHPDAKRRFTHEAQAAAKIGHPAILDVYDLGDTDDGSLYMVMELLTGESLAERVSRGPLPISEALRYTLGVLTALEAAHEAGIIHRDIKPANVFVVEGEVGADAVRVLDFGIAKFQATTDGAKTNTGAVLGSPHYMAPEQVRAEPEIDSRVDIWAVGAMLYELLVGEPAHLAPTHAAVIARIVLKQAPKVSERREEVDAGLDEIVARALEIDPEKRFASAAEMRKAVEEYLVVRAATIVSLPPSALPVVSKARTSGSGETPRAVVAATTDLTPLEPPEEPKRRSLVSTAIAAFLVASAVATAVYVARTKRTEPAMAETEPKPSAASVRAPEPSSSSPPAAPSASASAARSSAAPSSAASATASATASASPSASASASAGRRPVAPPATPARPAACAPGEELTNGHCCPRGFMWQGGRCERDIAVTPPF